MPNTENIVTQFGINFKCRNSDGVANPLTIRQLKQMIELASQDLTIDLDSPVEILISDGNSSRKYSASIWQVQAFDNGIRIQAGLPRNVSFRTVRG